MRGLPIKLLAVAVSITLSGVMMAAGDDDVGTLPQLSGYRQWTKMNPEPAKVDTPANFAAIAGG